MRARLRLGAALVLGVTVGLAVLLSAAASAQGGPVVAIEPPPCLPSEQHGVVRGSATDPMGPGQSVRLFFRWLEEKKAAKDQQPFYWVAMEPEPGGRYWAIPPRPEKRNEEVELYTAVVDAAGKQLAHSETKRVKVKDPKDCRVKLDAKEEGVAANLTIGETGADQQQKKVWGFLCDGIATRVNYQNIRRADEQCRNCVVAWWKTPGVLVPGALGVAGVVVIVAHHHHHGPTPEPSPSTPE